MIKKNKALIAMSGGVDSSVAACLMKQKGYECMGVTMKLYANEDVFVCNEHTCCSADDIADARRVAEMINIPYYVFNFSDKFKEKVIDNFVECYESGRTPNPCIECNRWLKFEHLYHRMKELEYDMVVTGHYARIEYCEEMKRHLLKKAVDDSKDQSYVLYTLTKEQLEHTYFPLGELMKTDTRKLAEDCGLNVFDKPDSQDICFVQNGKYADFIENYNGKRCEPGDFVDLKGNILGRHKGIINYTIGQRKGLGLPAVKPWYVVRIEPDTNRVVLGDNIDLFSDTLIADNVNLISIDSIEKPLRLKAKVRYRHKEQPCTVTGLDDGRIKVVFDEPQRAITSGQAVVLYDEDIVVGGGTIV